MVSVAKQPAWFAKDCQVVIFQKFRCYDLGLEESVSLCQSGFRGVILPEETVFFISSILYTFWLPSICKAFNISVKKYLKLILHSGTLHILALHICIQYK